MSQQGDPQTRQEDDWWRQLYDEEAAAGASPAAASDSLDEHFDSALTAMDRGPAPSPAADTLRLRRPTPPPPPPSWPRPTRGEVTGERSPAVEPAEEQAAGPEERAVEPPPWDAWAARPMFPTPRSDAEEEAPGGWTEAPSPAEPWSPAPRPPARPQHPAAAPPEAAPRPAEPWTSPRPAEPAPTPAEPPEAETPDPQPPAPPVRVPVEPNPYATRTAWPPLGRPPAPPDPETPSAEPVPVESSPYAPSAAWPPLGRAAEEPGPSVRDSAEPSPYAGSAEPAEALEPPGPSVRDSAESAEPVPDPAPPAAAPSAGERVESGPYASSAAWPPLGRAPEEPEPVAEGSPYAFPAEGAEPPGPSVREGVEPSAQASPADPVPDSVSSASAIPAPGRKRAEPAPWPPVGPAPERDASATDLSPEAGRPGSGGTEAGADSRAAGGETAFAEGGVRWAPELPPGWVAAEEEGEPAAAVVGGGPPTYAAEPTAWPEADPDRLDGLVPDTVLDGARYGSLTLRTASVRGDSARYRGQPRRDAMLTARFGAGDDALLLVATATGARAADDAHRAAQDAVRWIAGAVGRSRERLAGDLRAARRGSLKSGLHRLTDRCYGRLRARGEDLGLEEGEYTASLRCMLLPVDPECRIRLFFGVGAGGLFRVRAGTWQDLDMAPDDTAAPFRFRATLAQPGDALLMCSAGLAEPLRGEPALAARLAERWGEGRVPGLPGYLADVQTRVKGYADDRTAVTVWDA